MSKIFEALRHAEQVRTSASREKNRGGESADFFVEPPAEVRDRRQSQRRALDIPVYVYGHGPGKETFHEEAHTLRVNENGALLLLSVPIRQGQRLLLTNTLTQQELDCHVVLLGARHSRTVETGVAFSSTNPDFWKSPKSRSTPPPARPELPDSDLPHQDNLPV